MQPIILAPGHLLLLPVVDGVVTMQHRLTQDEEFGAQWLWKFHLGKIASCGPVVAEKLGKQLGKNRKIVENAGDNDQHLGNYWEKLERWWNVAEQYGGKIWYMRGNIDIWLVEFPYCPFNFHEIP